MRFGTDKRNCILLVLLLIVGITNACSQSKEMKMKESQQHAEKALTLRQQGSIKEAIQEQLQAIEKNPENSELTVNLLAFYLDDKNYDKAKETAEKALKSDPNNAWINYLFGELLEEQKNYREALKYRSRAAEIEPENPLFLSNLGSVQESAGDDKSAKDSFNKALQFDSDYIFALQRLAKLEEKEGNTPRAIELYEKVMKISPEQYQTGDEFFVEEAEKRLEALKKNSKP